MDGSPRHSPNLAFNVPPPDRPESTDSRVFSRWRVRRSSRAAWTIHRDDPAVSVAVLDERGRDALTMANQLFERYDLASVTPRFLRVVPGPIT